VNLFVALRWGARAGRDPWGSRTLEWRTDSPPPAHNFAETPAAGDPYGYEPSEERDGSPAG
jgi:cytochrome c oxidase subunit 1